MGIFDRRSDAPPAVPTADDANAATPPGGIENERGIPPINPRAYQSRGQVVMIGGAVLLLLALMWAVNRPPPTPAVASSDPRSTREQPFDEQKSGAVVVPPETGDLLAPPKPPAPPIEIVPAIDGAAPAARGARELTPLQRRMKSKTVIYDATSARNARASEVPGLPGLRNDGTIVPGTSDQLSPYLGRAQAGEALRSALVEGNNRPERTSGRAPPADDDGIGALLRPTELAAVTATQLPDRTLMISGGTKYFDCIMDTAINTSVAGITRCTLSNDVYGEDGKVVLLDRGTELRGEYRSGLRTGQARLGIVWSRAKTPNGIIIELSSPATDSLGRGGVDGYVDKHFWERYGGALLLSSLDDALSLLINRADENDDRVYVPQNTSRTGRDAAAVALDATIRIPPTIIKHQGDHVGVLIARDLDFRSVYRYRGPPLLSHNE